MKERRPTAPAAGGEGEGDRPPPRRDPPGGAPEAEGVAADAGAESGEATAKPMGLARTIAKRGRATRPEAESLIRSGRVRVDGRLVHDPSRGVRADSQILIDGEPLVEVERRYYAFHKPAEIVIGPGERDSVRSLRAFLPPSVPGLRAAGRLDAATTGLVLISNDAQWNARAAGGAGFEKEYQILVPGVVSDLELGVIAAGVRLPRLGFVKPLSVRIEQQTAEQTIVRMVLIEGKNRQIRRLFHTLRYDSVRLHRVRIGPIALGELEPGRLRLLSIVEIDQVRHGRPRREIVRGRRATARPTGEAARAHPTGAGAPRERPAQGTAPERPKKSGPGGGGAP